MVEKTSFTADLESKSGRAVIVSPELVQTFVGPLLRSVLKECYKFFSCSARYGRRRVYLASMSRIPFEAYANSMI